MAPVPDPGAEAGTELVDVDVDEAEVDVDVELEEDDGRLVGGVDELELVEGAVVVGATDVDGTAWDEVPSVTSGAGVDVVAGSSAGSIGWVVDPALDLLVCAWALPPESSFTSIPPRWSPGSPRSRLGTSLPSCWPELFSAVGTYICWGLALTAWIASGTATAPAVTVDKVKARRNRVRPTDSRLCSTTAAFKEVATVRDCGPFPG